MHRDYFTVESKFYAHSTTSYAKVYRNTYLKTKFGEISLAKEVMGEGSQEGRMDGPYDGHVINYWFGRLTIDGKTTTYRGGNFVFADEPF